jgi:glutamine amidotransferase-like uncharacterized protein
MEVFAGRGASHSLVWLVDLLGSAGRGDVSLVGADEFRTVADRTPSCVVVSGGDGYEIAGSIGPEGFSSLSDYISEGGLYIGMCAGAYMPLPSRVEPFSSFNLSTTRIRNIDPGAPPADARGSRFSVPYGCCSIVHPVRGMVSLAGHAGECVAPTYGGPVFEEPEVDEVLLRFRSFTEETEFQAPEEAARAMMVGKPAAVVCRHGRGRMVLLGPHLEFPGCEAGNGIFLDLLPEAGEGRTGPHIPRVARSDRGLDGAIADARVAVLGLENRSFVSSSKVWDGGRLMELLDCIGRMRWAAGARSDEVAGLLCSARAGLMSIDAPGADDTAETPFELVEALRLCANGYFAALRR